MKNEGMQIGDFYQYEDEEFNWHYFEFQSNNDSAIISTNILTGIQVKHHKRNIRQIPITDEILTYLGITNGRIENLVILPTYHFWGKEFKGCCNPAYGYQVIKANQYPQKVIELNKLLQQAKEKYTHPIDLYYDKTEYIRKNLNALYNINQLMHKLNEYKIDTRNIKKCFIKNFKKNQLY